MKPTSGTTSLIKSDVAALSGLIQLFQEETFAIQIEINVSIRVEDIKRRVTILQQRLEEFDRLFKESAHDGLKKVCDECEKEIHHLIEEAQLIQLNSAKMEVQSLIAKVREDWRNRKKLLSGL